MQDFTQDVSPREQGASCNVPRILSCCAALVALAASLWAAGGIGVCAACQSASALAFGKPLAWTGVAFYALLTLGIATRKHSRWTVVGFFAASGVHAALLIVLARERLLCAACVTAAAAAISGAVLTLAARQRRGLLSPAAAFFAAGIAALAGIHVLHGSKPQGPAQLSRLAAQRAPAIDGRIKLVLYEREGCKHCLDFEENVLPNILQALGDAAEVERRDADVDMETPTLVVQGKTSRTFVGTIDEREVEDAVRQMR